MRSTSDNAVGRKMRRTAAVVAGLLGLVLLVGSAVAESPSSLAKPCTEISGPTRALGLFKPGDPVDLDEGFRDPPPISRVQCWWQCHGSAFAKTEITRQLEEFKAKGMGGVTVKDTLTMPREEHTAQLEDIPFMSPEWLDMLDHIVAECGRLGLICRCRLGSGWNAGGPWVSPEMSSQIVAFASSPPLTGPTKYAGQIPLAQDGLPKMDAIRDGEAFVVAVRQPGGKGIDLTDKVTGDRRLEWDVPPGAWTLFSCFSRPSGRQVMSCSPSGSGLHHDHLSEAGTDLQLRMVAEPILAKLGRLETTAFDGFNCDSWELGNPTWTPGFRRVFLARRGYDPVPYLAALAVIQDSGIGRSAKVGELSQEGSRFLHDLRDTVSDLAVQTHYHRVSQWCRKHGVAFEAQAGGPSYVPRDMLQAQGAVDIPMGEFWMPERSHVKVASSAAHIYGKRLVGLESFTETRSNKHFAVAPADMKHRVDEAFLLGGNYLNLAVTEYSPVEAGQPGWVHAAAPHLNHCQSWWAFARPVYDYLARCCFLLQSGRNVAQVAVYRDFRNDKTKLWHEGHDPLSTWPKEFAFDYVNDDILRNRMQVRDGQIRLDSGAAYQILYVIGTGRASMPLATLAKISDLLREGATVVWAGPPPSGCPGLTGYPDADAQFESLVEEVWNSDQLIRWKENDLRRLVALLANSADPPGWKTIGDKPLRFVHRRMPDADVFFVVNRATWTVDTPVTFRTKGRPAELWIPESGIVEPAVFEEAEDGTRVAIHLAPLESLFVVFREEGSVQSAPQRREASDKVATSMAIAGPWEVAFPEGLGAPPKATFSKLASWTERDEPGIRHFSGVATYRVTFTLTPAEAEGKRKATLDLGCVAEICEVRLNGKLLGTGWHPPYRFDVTGVLCPGENRLEIRVVNLWHNRLVGDAALPKTDRVSRMVPESHYDRLRGQKLIRSGLLGPVKLLFGP